MEKKSKVSKITFPKDDEIFDDAQKHNLKTSQNINSWKIKRPVLPRKSITNPMSSMVRAILLWILPVTP